MMHCNCTFMRRQQQQPSPPPPPLAQQQEEEEEGEEDIETEIDEHEPQWRLSWCCGRCRESFTNYMNNKSNNNNTNTNTNNCSKCAEQRNAICCACSNKNKKTKMKMKMMRMRMKMKKYSSYRNYDDNGNCIQDKNNKNTSNNSNNSMSITSMSTITAIATATITTISAAISATSANKRRCPTTANAATTTTTTPTPTPTTSICNNAYRNYKLKLQFNKQLIALPTTISTAVATTTPTTTATTTNRITTTSTRTGPGPGSSPSTTTTINTILLVLLLLITTPATINIIKHKPNTITSIAATQLAMFIHRTLPTSGMATASAASAATSISSQLPSNLQQYQQRLLQQQHFALLNNKREDRENMKTSTNHHTPMHQMLKTIDYDDDNIGIGINTGYGMNGGGGGGAAATTTGLRNEDSHDAASEIIGFVSDDGQQYEQATKMPRSANRNNGGPNICPKECKCLGSVSDCSGQNLTRIPFLPDYIKELDLINNYLNDTSVLELRNMPKLHRLILKRNQLEHMPIFEGLDNLERLNLAHNRIKRISNGALVALPKLKFLDLSRNQLHTLEANHFPPTNRLMNLLLNGNKMTTIDERAFESLTNLVDLELNSNRLVKFNGSVFKTLSKLRKLSLNANQLEINWSTFKGLSALQKLYLSGNNIRGLQDGVFHVMHAIEIIRLDYNNITSLSRQGLFNLTKLQHLYLSNNLISRIEPDTWEFTQSLVSLDLSDNRISNFKPQHLDCLNSLQYLNLGYNRIQYLSETTFDCVKNLEELNLRENRLAWNIEDPSSAPVFKPLRKLKKLDLLGNNLKQIHSKSFSGLNSLQSLQLDDNPLATIQSAAFDQMPYLQKLNINILNLICDCEILGFRNWILNHSMLSENFISTAICSYPKNLNNQALFTLSPDQLLCADSPKPVITQEPHSQLAVKGANLTLECIASSPTADSLEIKWRHDNQLIKDSHDNPSGEMQFQHDSITNQTIITGYLHLYNVSYESAGRFQCVVSNEYGTAYSQRFKLSIGIHPTFLQIPSNLTIDTGDTARLVCSATGDPMPEISLQKFGGSDFPAATERRLQIIRTENVFIITNAKVLDTGIYTCTADSAAGEIKINATLTVNDKPLPEIPHERKETVQNETTVLQCLNDLAADLTLSNREWYKDNKPFHTSSVSVSDRYYFTREKELLVIVNTQPSDAGQYRCEITDNSKTITVQFELVVVKEDFSSMVVIIIIVAVTILCLLISSIIVWFVLYMQRRKLPQSGVVGSGGARVAVAPHHTLSGSRGSALDQTQLTTMNCTYLQQAQQLPYHHPLQHHNYSRQRAQSSQKRPHSLADLDLHMNGQQHHQQLQPPQHTPNNRVIITQTPHYQPLPQQGNEGFTLEFIHRNSMHDLDQHQDHLSSKDSGTGSDAAVKRSMEDFSIALLPSGAHHEVMPASSTPAKTIPGSYTLTNLGHNAGAHAILTKANNDYNGDDDDDDDAGTVNGEDFMPAQVLDYAEDGIELCETVASKRLNGDERESFLQNNIHVSRFNDCNNDVSGRVGGNGHGVGIGNARASDNDCSTPLLTPDCSSAESSTKYNSTAAIITPNSTHLTHNTVDI